MKVICIFLVLLAVFQGSQSRAPKFTEKVSVRTPFFRRQRIIHSPLIVGGTPTTIAAHPHHLGLLDLIFGGYICGASNISPIWALSAAHCLEFGHSPNVINLWGGSTSRLTGGHIFIVESYTLHPQYDDISLDNDVAVLRVNDGTRLENHLHVQPVVLSGNCATACCDVCVPGSPITVAGWGADDNGQLPINLLQVVKPLFDQAECNRIWNNEITSNMFCTAIEGGRDSCGGDSGGAIIRNGIQVGVVSFGSEVCGDGTAPAVYARLESPIIRNWIRTMTGV